VSPLSVTENGMDDLCLGRVTPADCTSRRHNPVRRLPQMPEGGCPPAQTAGHGPMQSAARCCRSFGEIRNHLHSRSHRGRNLPPNSRRHRFLTRGIISGELFSIMVTMALWNASDRSKRTRPP
jgi:hypothetical protein